MRSGPAIRVWVAGCSTGEEAYSIAMLFHGSNGRGLNASAIKIFATISTRIRLSPPARGSTARISLRMSARSPLSTFLHQEEQQLHRFAELRKMVIFAPQNVFQDPPFGKLDLISCRNMMIYFQNSLQKDLFAIFHSCPERRRGLFLGRSESVSGCGDIYEPLCPNEKIFTHNAGGHAPKDMTVRFRVPPIDGDLCSFIGDAGRGA
jgi:two-component system CheB/CheR fusion protein